MFTLHRLTPAVFAVLLLAGLASAQLQYQNMIPIPSYASTYSGTYTRGFVCQVPVDLTVVGLRVPDEQNQGQQHVCLYTSPTLPPAYTATVNLTPVFSKFGEPSANIIPCSVPYKKGEFLSVLGACATTIGASMKNSYAATGNFNTTIFGQATTLMRCGTQNNISTLPPPHPVWSINNSTISRVEVYVASATLTGSGTPSPGSTINYTLKSPGDAGLPYQLGSSFGPGPIPLGSRKLELSVDKLLELSVSGLAPGIFNNYTGTLDATGAATAALKIPNIPALKGTRIYSAFVTLQNGAPMGVKSISNNFLITIT